MTERIKAILDAVTEKVLAYRPVDKGLAAKKTKRRLACKAKADLEGSGVMYIIPKRKHCGDSWHSIGRRDGRSPEKEDAATLLAVAFGPPGLSVIGKQAR